MSGLCAVVDFAGAPVDRAMLLAMAAAASRRGPDGASHRIIGDVGLCHLALHATAESLNERQPVSSPEGSIYVVADLRLDNRGELIDHLVEDGLLVRNSPGDAELLLAAYQRWGTSCPAHLLGDFAFVLWDARKRQIFGACDPLGIKPLHYARTGSLLCLASEAQQVLRHPAVPRGLDEVAVGDHLLDVCSEPERTLFRGVRRLPPGHCLAATSRGERIERFWSLDPEARTLYRRDEDYAVHFLDLFRRTVGDRLRTQAGTVGILMSGGLDSCSVAAAASRSLPTDGSLRLFAASFVFNRLQECDERPFIQAAATDLGLESELICAERFPVLGDAGAGRPALEGPFLAWDGCFHEALRRAKRLGARVLLTGHGGDDLLTGSASVYADRVRSGDLKALFEIAQHAMVNRRAWRWIVYKDLVQPLLPRSADRLLRRLYGRASGPELPDWIDAGFARRIGLGRIDPPRPQHFAEKARQELYDHFQQTPWDRTAAWYDQHAAAFGIEVRHPFLDRRLVEFLFSIPPGRLFRTDLSKPLLRQAMAGLLPEMVRQRRNKTRLGPYLDLALREEQRQIERLLAAPLAEELGFVDGARLRAAYKRFQEGMPAERDDYLWYSVALEVWLREHDTSVDMNLPSMVSSSAIEPRRKGVHGVAA